LEDKKNLRRGYNDEIPNPNFQIPNKSQAPMTIIPNSLEHLNLKFGYCLGFDICNLGFIEVKGPVRWFKKQG
jgi:hypothetical protein